MATPITRIQTSGWKRTSVSAPSFSIAISPSTAGKLIVVHVSKRNGAAWPIGAISDDVGNAYQRATFNSDSATTDNANAIFYCENCKAGATSILVNMGTSQFGGGCATEWNGIRTTGALDTTGRTEEHLLNSSSYSGVTDLTSQANTLLIAGVRIGSFSTGFAPSSTAWTEQGLRAQEGGTYSRIADDIGYFSCRFIALGNADFDDLPGVIAAFKGVDVGVSSGSTPGVNPIQPLLSRGIFDIDDDPSFSQAQFASIGTGTMVRKYVLPTQREEAITGVQFLAAGTLSNLAIKKDAAVTNGQMIFVVRVNGLDSGLSVAFSGSQTTRRNITRSVHVNAGDVVTLGIYPRYSATGAAPTSGGFDPERLSIDFEPDVAAQNVYGWGTQVQLSTSAVQYNGVFNGAADPSSYTLATAKNLVAAAGQIEEIAITLEAAPGAGKSRTFAIYRNGAIVPSTVVVISGTSTAARFTLASPLALSPGDYVALETSSSGTPAASCMNFSMRYVVATNGQSQMGVINRTTGSTSVSTFNRPNGGQNVADSWVGVVRIDETQIPVGPTPFTLSGLQVALDVAPGAAKQYAVRANLSGVGSASLVATVAGAAATTADSGSGFANVVDGDLLALELVPTGTPASARTTFSMIVTTELPSDDAELAATLEGEGELFEQESAFEEGPILTWIEIMFSDLVTRVWSSHKLNDPAPYYEGEKLRKVDNYGTIRRSLSDDSGKYEGTDFQVTLDDSDLSIRQLLAASATRFFPNRPVVARSISDTLRRILATPRTIFRGIISRYKPAADLKFVFTFADYFSTIFSPQSGERQIPKRVVTTVDFPHAPQGAGDPNSSLTKTYLDASVVNLTDVSDAHYDYTGYVQLSNEAQTVNLAGQVPNGTWNAGGGSIRGWVTFSAVNGAVITVAADLYSPSAQLITFASPDVASALEEASGGTTNFATVGLAVPIPYGTIDESPAVYVGRYTLSDGRSYHKFILAGCAIQGIDGIFTDNGATGVGTNPASATGDLALEAGSGGNWVVPGYLNWTELMGADLFEDLNGRRYTTIYGLVGNRPADVAAGFFEPLTPESIRLYVRLRGIESVGDGTGTLLIDAFDIRLHLLQNWIFGDYQSGAWLGSPMFPDDPTLSMIDEASFARNSEIANRRVSGGYYLDFIIGATPDNATSEFVSVSDLEARANISTDANSYRNHKGQYAVSMVDDSSYADPAATLTALRHIHEGSFDIEDDQAHHFTVAPFRHSKDYLGREREGWKSIYTGVVEQVDDAAVENYGTPGAPLRLLSPLLELHMVRGKNLSTDLDVYERGTTTANDVVGRFLMRHKDPPRLVTLRVGWKEGQAVDLGDTVLVTHFGGVGSEGWVERPCRVIRHEADPQTYSVLLTLYDLYPILQAFAVYGDRSTASSNWATASAEERSTLLYAADRTTGTFADGEPPKRYY